MKAREKQVLLYFKSWYAVPGYLKTKTMLRGLGLNPTAPPMVTVWNTFNHIDLYDLNATKPRKRATPPQLSALEKARAKRRENKCKREEEIRARLEQQWREEEVAFEVERDEAARLQHHDDMIRWARKQLGQPESFCILDVESTGLEYTDEVCSIAVLAGDSSPLLDTLIKPTKLIPEEVIAIHGITDEKVRNSPRFVDIYDKLLEVVGDKRVFIYNSSFDIAVMNRSLTACGSFLQIQHYEWVPFENGALQQAHLAFPGGVTCVMEKYARFVGEWSQYWGNYRYQPLLGGDHTALGDCRAVLELLYYMAKAQFTYPTEEESQVAFKVK